MVVVLGGVGNLLGTVLASFGIGIMTDLIGAGRLLSIWPDMPLPLSNTINFLQPQVWKSNDICTNCYILTI